MLWKITALGDTALLLPVSVLVFGCLLIQGRRDAAFAWAVAIIAAGGLTVLAKLGFHLCGAELEGVAIRSPSGHTSISATVYGAFGVLVASGRSFAVKLVAAILATTLVAAIGFSRAALRVHTMDEVVLGYLIGGLCVVLFLALIARAGWPRISLAPLAIGFLVALIALGGLQLNVEHQIGRLSRLIGGAVDVCR